MTKKLYLCSVKQFICKIIVAFLCMTMLSCTPSKRADEFALENYQRGRELRAEGKEVEAMQCFIDAAHSGTTDMRLLGRVYSNMANMCRQAERHELACTLYEQSTGFFNMAHDTLAVAYALNNMAWEKAVMGEKAPALALVDSAVRLFPSEEVLSKVKESQAAACLYAQQYDSAIYFAHQIEDTVYGYMLLAQAFALVERCDSALFYVSPLVEQTLNPRYLDDIYYILSHCDSTAATSDVIALTDKRTDVQRELEQFKSEMAQAVLLLQQPEQDYKTLWFILIGFVPVIGFMGWLYLNGRSSSKHKVEQSLLHIRQSRELKKDLQLSDYPAFCHNVDSQLYGLAGKLRSRGLTEREVRIAVLVLLEFSYAEIADMLNRAESGIGKDKYIIAKKLGVRAKSLKNELLSIASKE